MGNDNKMTSTPDEPTEAATERKPMKWEDPSVPAGNAPSMSKWPLTIMLFLWFGWVGFLAAIRFGIL